MDSTNGVKDQLVEKLQASTNILVTVSRDPSVDQLAACLGLTLLLNKFGKHATAVFSGEVPSTIEFLQPEQTLEKTTDSLRDFIIALDKSKADKLRYKVEDEMVRIFITPFRVSLTDKDLEFSQGDFNVDVVIALGVTRQEDFDAAITAHGRILHDAVVSSIATTGGGELGSINWAEPNSSSLSEIIVSLAHSLGANLLDPQISTALLTGIVSETERFSNEKTTPQTMSISAELMAAGANQQLVATELTAPVVDREPAADEPAGEAAEKPADETDPSESVEAKVVEDHKTGPVDGTLEIDHEGLEKVLQNIGAHTDASPPTDNGQSELPEPVQDQPAVEEDDHKSEPEQQPPSSKSSRLIVEPPTLGGTLTANSEPERLDPANDALGLNDQTPPALLSRPAADKSATRRNQPALTGFTPPPPAWIPATQDATNMLNDPEPKAEPEPSQHSDPIDTTKTLADIEAAVLQEEAEEKTLDTARNEVERALSAQPEPPAPVQALGAHPLGDPLRAATAPASFADMLTQVIPPAPGVMSETAAPAQPPSESKQTVHDPMAPPPVPPPIPFNFGSPPPPPHS